MIFILFELISFYPVNDKGEQLFKSSIYYKIDYWVIQ